MNIIEKTYKWNGTLSARKSTKYIIIHHMAGTGSADDVHRIHVNKGWTGIGYNFFVRLDGKIYRGRPIDKAGAHTTNYNSVSVGICFEGNYETTKTMPEAQKKAGKELVSYLKGLYPSAVVKKHRDLNSTACPGKHFPFDEITSGKATTQTTTKAAKTANVSMPIIQKGSEGYAVKTAQRLLVALGFSCGKSGIDGDFGTATHTAVVNFQKKNGLDADGIIGGMTWNKLLNG